MPRVYGARGSGKDSSVDALEARLKAQMLDGNAALLSLADDPDDYLFQVWHAPYEHIQNCRTRNAILLLALQKTNCMHSKAYTLLAF